MNTHYIQTVPLTETEKSFLMVVYRKRLMLLIKAYMVLVPLVAISSFRSLDTGSQKITRWEQKDDAKYVSRLGMYFISFGLLGLATIVPGLYIYYSRVRAVKKDADSGHKDKIPYTISRKQYFPLTNQYFVWIDDPENLDHEVDETTYYNCDEGDIIYIYRASRSKLVFEKDGKYDLL